MAAGLLALFAPQLHAQMNDKNDQAMAAPPGWKLTWSDEFSGSSINRHNWGFEIGNGGEGWGNHELEYYTDRPANAYVAGGMLHIRAAKESYNGSDYTSARMLSRGLFSQKYGRFDFRAKLPVGRGLWPALWFMPEDNTYGNWPLSGEIDLTESRGQQPDRVLGTIHFGAPWPHNSHSGETYVLPDGGTVAQFHVYTLEWEPGVIRWYVDGKIYSTKRRWWSQSPSGGRNPWPEPFDQRFFIIMNVAVGGDVLGSPDASTQFPQEMVVDYVRAYEKVGGYGPIPPPEPAASQPQATQPAAGQ
jgi:beta-glucanase (GH16 family)